jgi:CBS domain-containing protein
MTRALVLLPKEMSLPGAAHLLAQAQVSGAPVVNDAGECIGVLSATDFLTYAESDRAAANPGPYSVSAWQLVDSAPVPHNCVADYMTKDVVTVAPGTLITDIARTMVDAHIHRVIVMDERRRPLGVVSSTDILAAVAQADEH